MSQQQVEYFQQITAANKNSIVFDGDANAKDSLADLALWTKTANLPKSRWILGKTAINSTVCIIMPIRT